MAAIVILLDTVMVFSDACRRPALERLGAVWGGALIGSPAPADTPLLSPPKVPDSRNQCFSMFPEQSACSRTTWIAHTKGRLKTCRTKVTGPGPGRCHLVPTGA